MRNWVERDYIGKFAVETHFNACSQCRRLTLLGSYTTTQFIKILGMPLLPTARRRILDECLNCGTRGITAARKYARERKHNLSMMMDGFAAKADNPANCSHALHTLMIYNEAAWFNDVHKSYGLRFDTNPQIQYLIAQGFCRFGEYDHAIEHCRKAIVLGTGKPAEKLLAFCQRLMESRGSLSDLDALRIKPESARTAYLPLAAMAASLTLLLISQSIIALRTHTAWLVNGSLQQYAFTLDNETYTLLPGSRQKIKMHIGRHELQMQGTVPREFTYNASKFRQLIRKELLVINPDAMALLTVEEKSGPHHFYGRTIHTLTGAAYPLFGLGKHDDETPADNRISFYRPETHMALVQRLHEQGLPEQARDYARRALAMNPKSLEAAPLLATALNGADHEAVANFMRRRLAISPSLLPWHLYYQNHVLSTQEQHTLIEEYTARFEEHPDEPGASYLLGRVINDPEASRKFFLYSERNVGMNGRGYYAIAYALYCRGSFQEALNYSKKVLQKNPDHLKNLLLREKTLLALKMYDELLALEGSRQHQVEEKNILYLTCAGYHREAEEAVTRHSNHSAQRHSELDAIRYYAVGNITDYMLSLAETQEQTATFQKFMHQNNMAEANRVLTADENHLWSDHLVLYCGTKLSKDEHIASVHLQKAVQEIDKTSFHQKQMGRMLESRNAPALEEIKTLQVSASEKALLCATLGFRFPDQKQEFHALAHVYNFTPSYPQLLVKQWTQHAAR